MKLATQKLAGDRKLGGLLVLLALATCRVQAPLAPQPTAQSTADSRTADEPVALPSELRPGEGLLRVRVVDREGEAPLADVDVLVSPSDLARQWTDYGGRPRSISGNGPTTGGDGWTDIAVPIHVDLRVNTSGWEEKRESSIVPALSDGERREVVLRVIAEADTVLFGRLVDAESKAVIKNGRVHLESNDESNDASEVANDIATDAEGRFKLIGPARDWPIATASAPGFASLNFVLSTAHTHAKHALDIELSRSAVAEVRVLDHNGSAVSGAHVRLSTERRLLRQYEGNMSDYRSAGADAIEWTSITDDDGRCVIERLAPNVPLSIECSSEGKLPQREPQPMVLSPAERRALDIVIAPTSTIRGLVLDQYGRPKARLQMWLMLAEDDARVLFGYDDEPSASTKSDADGRFEFRGVPPGLWWIGPANSDSDLLDGETVYDYAPVAMPVRVDAGVAIVVTTIHADRELHIRGTVLDEQGAPVPEVEFMASCGATLNVSDESSDESGDFRIGPICAGSWTVTANDYEHGRCASQVVDVVADRDDDERRIELHLHAEGVLRADIVDGVSGAARDGIVMLGREDGGDVPSSAYGHSLSEWTFVNVAPATYMLFALAADGRVALARDVVVPADKAVPPVVLALQPNATVRMSYTGKARLVTWTVNLGGVVLERETTQRTLPCAVPPGDVVIEFTDATTHAVLKRKVHLTAGEERDVVFDAP
jgi:hypothetical protein